MYSYQSLFYQFPLFQFFNYELLVTMSFFFFLLFAILQEKGQLGSYFKELSIEARSKFSRHLDSREEIMRELSSHLIRSADNMRKIMLSYEATSSDTILYLQYIAKALSKHSATSRAKSYLDSVESTTRYLSVQVRRYITHALFHRDAVTGAKISGAASKNSTGSAPSVKGRLKVLVGTSA